MSNAAPFSWPPWVELRIIDLVEVRITVTHGALNRSWISRRNLSHNNETWIIIRQVKADLAERQAAIDAVTKRLST